MPAPILVNSIPAQDVLTTSAVAIHTATDTEHLTIMFINLNAANRTITIYINGTGSLNTVAYQMLIDALGGRIEFDIDLGPADEVYALASAGTSVYYTIEDRALV